MRTRGRLFQTGRRFVEIQITPTGRPTGVCPGGIPVGDGVPLDLSGLGPADDCRGNPLRLAPSGRGISASPMQPRRPSDRTLGIALRSVRVPNTLIYRTRSPPCPARSRLSTTGRIVSLVTSGIGVLPRRTHARLSFSPGQTGYFTTPLVAIRTTNAQTSLQVSKISRSSFPCRSEPGDRRDRKNHR